MADQVISASGAVANIVPEVWSARYTQNLNDNVAFNSLISREYEGEIRSMGDTVNIPTIADVDASLLTEGARGDAQTITVSKTALVVNSRAFVDFIVTDQASLQSLLEMDKLRELAVSALARKMQDDIVDAIVPSASAPDHAIAYDSGTTLADADLLEALDLEADANWSHLGGRYLVTGEKQYLDLVNTSKFYDKTLGGNSNVSQGELSGSIYGHTPGSSTACGTTTYMFHDSFMQMAVQKDLSINLYDLGGQGQRAWRLNVDVLYGIKQVFDTRVVSIG